MEYETFFAGFARSQYLFSLLQSSLGALGPMTMKVQTSQIALCAGKPFAYVWLPARYLKGKVASLVVSVPLSYRDETVHWKEVISVGKDRYMHHKELWGPEDLDACLLALLSKSYHSLGGHDA